MLENQEIRTIFYNPSILTTHY